MNSERESLIRRLVDRKMASPSKNKIGCVPCFGMRSKNKTSGVSAASRSK